MARASEGAADRDAGRLPANGGSDEAGQFRGGANRAEEGGMSTKLTGDLGGALLASVSRSFYLSIKALPRDVRAPIGLAYLLARATDTIADSANASAAVRLKHLNAMRDM